MEHLIFANYLKGLSLEDKKVAAKRLMEELDEVTVGVLDNAATTKKTLMAAAKQGPAKTPPKVWSLADDDDEDAEMINENELLNEEDLKKPDPASLKVCGPAGTTGTIGKSKACADCSCGLAEELLNEDLQKIKENTQNAKSSCGSCYLGDAFRCGSCPYKGMPAFKPGEKVNLDMTPDLLK